MGYFVFAAIIMIGIYIYWGERKKWVTIEKAKASDREELQEHYASLKSQGVQCRLQISGKGSAEFCKATPDPKSLNTVRLQVKKKELEKLKNLLKEEEPSS